MMMRKEVIATIDKMTSLKTTLSQEIETNKQIIKSLDSTVKVLKEYWNL